MVINFQKFITLLRWRHGRIFTLSLNQPAAVAWHCLQIQRPWEHHLTLGLLNMGSLRHCTKIFQEQKAQWGRKQDGDNLPKVQDSRRDKLLSCGAALIAIHWNILSDLAITISTEVKELLDRAISPAVNELYIATTSAVWMLSNSSKGSRIFSPDICIPRLKK